MLETIKRCEKNVHHLQLPSLYYKTPDGAQLPLPTEKLET